MSPSCISNGSRAVLDSIHTILAAPQGLRLAEPGEFNHAAPSRTASSI